MARCSSLHLYTDPIPCLQAIEGEDTEKPLICYVMNLLWVLSDKGTRVRLILQDTIVASS